MHRIEWRTVTIAVVVYGGWLALTAWHGALALPALMLLGGWFIAWHGSLQHETIHGHPTRSSRINALIGGWPLSLWLPYRLYRRSHVAHHASPHPTHPGADPESRYLLRAEGAVAVSARLESSLTGRLFLGPVIALVRFAASETRRLRIEPRTFAADWGMHLTGLAIVLGWLAYVELPLGRYILCFVLPGQALTLLRGFAEHRADSAGPSRAATVESRGPLALLYLNNNLHAAHHARPDAPWYMLPAIERARSHRHEPRYRGYREIVERFAFRPHDAIVHPSIGDRAQ